MCVGGDGRRQMTYRRMVCFALCFRGITEDKHGLLALAQCEPRWDSEKP